MAECVNCKSQLSFFNTTQPLWEKTNQKLCSSCYRVIRDQFLNNPSLELFEKNKEYLIQHKFTEDGLNYIKSFCEYNDKKKSQKAHAQISKSEYSTWYSKQVENFLEEVKQNGFNATWGFESLGECNTQLGVGGKAFGNVFVFDVPELEGLVFDMESKQMLYYYFPTGYHEIYNNPDVKIEYKHVIIPFSDIFNASIAVNSHTVVTTETSKQNVVARSIVGGVLAGSTGAIIGGTTGKNTSTSVTKNDPEKVVLTIQTTNAAYPVISFEFNKSFYYKGLLISEKTMRDTMYGLFDEKSEYVYFEEREQKRNCNTTSDYCYQIKFREPEYDSNNVKEFMKVFDEIMPTNTLETILKRTKNYVMQIESIIEQSNKENISKTVTNDFMKELKALVEMKEKGYITDDEFAIFKSRLLK